MELIKYPSWYLKSLYITTLYLFLSLLLFQVLEAKVHQINFALERIFLSLKEVMVTCLCCYLLFQVFPFNRGELWLFWPSSLRLSGVYTLCDLTTHYLLMTAWSINESLRGYSWGSWPLRWKTESSSNRCRGNLYMIK